MTYTQRRQVTVFSCLCYYQTKRLSYGKIFIYYFGKVQSAEAKYGIHFKRFYFYSD